MSAFVRAHQDASGWVTLRFPYDLDTLAVLKSIPGSRWDKAEKVWRVSGHGWAILKHQLKHELVITSERRAPLPEQLASRLRPYQIAGAEHLVRSAGAFLTMDPRTGKTPTAITALCALFAIRAIRRAVVFYPAGVMGEWVRQLREWANIPLYVLEGHAALDVQEIARLRAEPYLIVGCHYEILRERGPDLQAIFGGLSSDNFAVVFDEIQQAKNRKSGRYTVASELTKLDTCVARWGLSGTPMRNRPRDLFAPFDLILPGSMGGYWTFAKRYCNPPEAPIWMGDYSFRPLGDVKVGDEVIGWSFGRPDTRTVKKGSLDSRRRLCRSRVVAVNRRIASLVTVHFESGRTIRCTPDHEWLADNHHSGLAYLPAKVGRKIIHVVDTTLPVTLPEHLWLAGWVAGMYDGEGHGNMISQSSEANPATWARLDYALTVLGIPHVMHKDRPHKAGSGAGGVSIAGGRDGFLKFVRTVCPARQNNGWDRALLTGRFRKPDRIVSIEPAGEGEVISMTTTTGNYVAWGYGSKNCGAYQGEFGWVDKDTTNAEELAARVATVSFRVTRAQVAPWLPKSDRNVIVCNLDKTQAKRYRALERSYAPQVKRAISDADPTGADRDALRALCAATSEAKIPATVERALFHAHDRQVKVLIFGHHHETLDGLLQAFTERYAGVNDAGEAKSLPPIFFATGKLPPAKRMPIIDEWRAHQGPAILIASSLASGTGIDLSDADAAIFIELEWVPSDFRQAEDRIQDVHLGKRTTPPIYEYMIVKNTVDEAMAAALLNKIRSIEQVIGHDAESTNLSATLRSSGVVSATNLALPNTDKETVQAALLDLRNRLLGLTQTDEEEAEQAQRVSVMADMAEHWDEAGSVDADQE